ncbi:hypothetical protein [uncultured Clostridium sp.]|uniref:hypothetical protein n=1 Tax=uncultured Clostridium sp. TaxID=59620 RepID=UPI0025F43D2B|nr:hypothetical protein [uncultured Clostridium sp.]
MNKREIKAELKGIIKVIQSMDLSREERLCDEFSVRIDDLVSFADDNGIGVDIDNLEDIKREGINQFLIESPVVTDLIDDLINLRDRFEDELDEYTYSRQEKLEEEVLNPLDDCINDFEGNLDDIDSIECLNDMLETMINGLKEI